MSEATHTIWRTEDHQYYWNGNGPFPSVTTAIGMYDKSAALMGWQKREISSFAIRHLDVLIAHREHNTPDPLICAPCAANVKRRKPVDRTEAARLWVASIPDYKKNDAADLGTEVHLIAERMALGHDDEISPALLPYAQQYMGFMEERHPEYLHIEYMGINTTHWYGGTGDFLAVIDGETWAVDIKTFTKPGPVPRTYYPTTGMQLAACTRFEFIEDANHPDPQPVPPIDRYAVLLVGTEDYALIEYRVTDRTFEAFLSCLNLYNWSKTEAQEIVR